MTRYGKPMPTRAIKALREAIQAIAQQGREIDTRRLGNFISKHENRREGGFRFVRAGEQAGVIHWSVMNDDAEPKS